MQSLHALMVQFATIFCIGDHLYCHNWSDETIYVSHNLSAWVGPFMFYPDHLYLCISGPAGPNMTK